VTVRQQDRRAPCHLAAASEAECRGEGRPAVEEQTRRLHLVQHEEPEEGTAAKATPDRASALPPNMRTARPGTIMSARMLSD